MKIVRQLREKEQRRADLFVSIANERMNRRAKEWVHEAILAYQHGMKVEDDIRKQQLTNGTEGLFLFPVSSYAYM